MVFIKPTVHVSRIAGTALKSFTHGYAQTVVAASQSSYASQNASVTPLANAYLSRFAQSGRTQLQHHHNVANQSSSGAGARGELSQSDLAQYYDAWQRHQGGDIRDWQQYQFAKTIGWKAPTTIPEANQPREEVADAVQDCAAEAADDYERVGLKRAYSTSAVDNFTKAIDNETAEAVAHAQVNEAIAEEIERSRQDVLLNETDSAPASTLGSDVTRTTSATNATSLDSPLSELDPFTQQLDQLSRDRQYAQIPAIFEAMLRAGISQPSPLAYRALLASALELTQGKHRTVPRALEVYSDMLRRNVTPDVETYTMLVNILALRATDAIASRAELDQKRARYGGRSFFRSDELEHAILSEDQSLNIALQVFKAGTSSVNFSSQTYGFLITACAKQGRNADMQALYEGMGKKSLTPQTAIFPAMIAAFASVGDLCSSVECYNDYKSLAIANNAGHNAVIRRDNEVYSAVVKAYRSCGRFAGGDKFFDRIQAEESLQPKLQALRDSVLLSAYIPLELEKGDFGRLATLADQISAPALVDAMSLAATSAADTDNVLESTTAFNALTAVGADVVSSAVSLLAMFVRNGDVESAEPYWRILESSPAVPSLVEPTVMRALGLIELGQAIRGVRQCRIMFGRIRELEQASDSARREVSERVEEAIEVLGRAVIVQSRLAQSGASVDVLRMMIDNGGLVSPLAEELLAGIGPEQIAQLPPSDLDVLTHVQSRMILEESSADIAGPARFACLLQNIISRSVLPDVATENLIEKTLINLDRSDLSQVWKSYRYPMAPAALVQPNTAAPHVAFDDSFDPYAARTDNKGSVQITDLLEKAHGRAASLLNEALIKFRNMRRAGRHPRFFAYAKLITAAAKENQLNISHDILEMAKQDVPLLPHYRVVRYGWVTILDSMLAACLVTGRRDLAANYHQDLLDMGATPSANTYGLYITTLKENTKTFDEASEAVKIFLRAKSEGVEPSSFLYNALIGKLGKARRIDDCLFYFTEMRDLGVRPTSVTYGTIVNALCRVSDEKFAEEIFEEMEGCANYKPRPAPYHSLMQYFLTVKRDRAKVLAYYERMRSKGIQPTMHTYKLLIDTHATLEPINMDAAETVLRDMRNAGESPEAVHYASLIHAKGCVLHDIAGARSIFDSLSADAKFRLQPCVYQAMFESLVANRLVNESDTLLADMRRKRVEMTPYIANALIHGWTQEQNFGKAKEAYGRVKMGEREPSTYEAMVRACLAGEDREGAQLVVREALSRGYPSAVATKIAELVSPAA